MIPRVYEVISGDFCSFHEVKNAGKKSVIAKKCMKKDLMKLVFASFTRSFFTFERISENASFCPNQDAGCSQ